MAAQDKPNRGTARLGEQELARGKGGEVHQTARGDAQGLTTNQGVTVTDDQNSVRAGAGGPLLMDDFHFREKLFHFDHERIPERVVHARGMGAKGYFEAYESLSDVTRADLFQREGEKTEVFVRFSTVAGNKGSPDVARDVRGFAVKFYTKEGNWDLVGNNIPVFFIQDALKFPDIIHSAKQEPDRGFPQAQTAHDTFWDFMSLTPESMHMAMWIMSDRTIPRSFRFMEGFGVHTFRFVNAEGRSTFVKFHWKPKLGLQSVVWNEALKLNGADPDFHRRQFYVSQTEVEQEHTVAAFIFELSKVETPAIRAIRARMVSHLLNIHEELGTKVGEGLRLKEMPEPADAAQPTREDLTESPALSIIQNGPDSFAGRKVGALVTDGTDAEMLKALTSALEDEGASLRIVAPQIGGVEASDGSWIEADEKLDGGPSVLFDAVALLPSEEGAQQLMKEPACRDSVADAFAHLKFIGHTQADRLFEGAGAADSLDDGVMTLEAQEDASAFVKACGKLRHWPREASMG